MKQTICTLAGALMMAATASAQDTLTLSDAVRFGLEHNLTVANASLQVDKADQDLQTARTRRLPQFKVETQASQLLRPIDLTFPRGAFGEFEGIGPVPAADSLITTPAKLTLVLNAQAAQPLTQLVKLNLNVRASESAREYQREQVREARLALIGQIKSAYYALVQTRSALAANEHSIALLRELNRVMTTRLVQQTALKGDALSLETQLVRAELTALDLRHTLDSQKEQLNQLIGRDVRMPFDVEAMPETAAIAIGLDTAQARAIADRPDVNAARLRLQQAEIAKRVARADYLPDVSLAFSYVSPINITGAPNVITTGAIQLQWEPFDWGRKGRALATKDIEIRQAQNALREAEDRAVLEVNRSFRRLETARAQLRAARLAEETARESARVSLTQYEVKAVLFSDVLDKQSSVADANHQYQQALAAFWSARADFERAMAEEVTQ